MSDMKKIFAIVIIIFFIITISGCINENNNNHIEDAKTEDLKFTINLDKYQFNVINNTNIYAEIENINKDPVRVIKTFDFHSNIYGELISPSNISYKIGTSMDKHVMGTKIELNHNEKIKTSIQMNELIYYIENKQGYNWSETGHHKMQFWYTSVQPYVYSNIVSFNLTK
jgi:hypothetical protein